MSITSYLIEFATISDSSMTASVPSTDDLHFMSPNEAMERG